MIHIRKILVPIDFSARCAWAASYARSLAVKFLSELTYFHVGAPSSIEQLREFTGGSQACCVVAQGDPAEKIAEFAKEWNADLIVMPTHAHGRFRRFVLGSVTAKVLHDVACPVWTGVHHPDAPAPGQAEIRNILCAIDADSSATPLVHWAEALAEKLGAKLHLVHAVPAADETSDNRGEMEVRRYLFARAKEKFTDLFDKDGTHPAVALAGGRIPTVVREACLRVNADLIVIGRGHTQAELGRLRTHSYAIIRESPSPVVSV